MNLEKIKQEVIELALEAGAFMKKERETFSFSKVELKGKNDLVSYVDREAEKIIVARLKEILPEAGFIAEEGTVATGDEELKWIIDPLDGTANYTHGLPCYSTSIALAKGSELLVGVVYDVEHDDCYHAHQGGGAYCNQEPIKISDNSTLDTAMIATGFPYSAFHRVDDYLKILKDMLNEAQGVRRWGSAALDLAYSARGWFEGFFEYNLNSYDVAAGALILLEAGGKVTDFQGSEDFLFTREIVAANGCHQELLDVVQRHW